MGVLGVGAWLCGKSVFVTTVVSMLGQLKSMLCCSCVCLYESLGRVIYCLNYF